MSKMSIDKLLSSSLDDIVKGQNLTRRQKSSRGGRGGAASVSQPGSAPLPSTPAPTTPRGGSRGNRGRGSGAHQSKVTTQPENPSCGASSATGTTQGGLSLQERLSSPLSPVPSAGRKKSDGGRGGANKARGGAASSANARGGGLKGITTASRGRIAKRQLSGIPRVSVEMLTGRAAANHIGLEYAPNFNLPLNSTFSRARAFRGGLFIGNQRGRDKKSKMLRAQHQILDATASPMLSRKIPNWQTVQLTNRPGPAEIHTPAQYQVIPIDSSPYIHMPSTAPHPVHVQAQPMQGNFIRRNESEVSTPGRPQHFTAPQKSHAVFANTNTVRPSGGVRVNSRSVGIKKNPEIIIPPDLPFRLSEEDKRLQKKIRIMASLRKLPCTVRAVSLGPVATVRHKEEDYMVIEGVGVDREEPRDAHESNTPLPQNTSKRQYGRGDALAPSIARGLPSSHGGGFTHMDRMSPSMGNYERSGAPFGRANLVRRGMIGGGGERYGR